MDTSSLPLSRAMQRRSIAAFLLVAVSALCNTVLLLQRHAASHSNRLPHYDKKDILNQLGVLTLPYVCTTSLPPLLDALLQELSFSDPSPLVFSILKKNEDRFQRLTRFSVVEFLSLYHELEAYIKKPFLSDRQASSLTHRRRLHSIDQFLLWLFHGDGNDPDLLGVLFNDISRRSVDRVADHVTSAVNEVWEHEVSWPDAVDRRHLHGFFSCCPTAVGVLDGTHCQIRVPLRAETEYYSGYKGYHTQNYLICADALGFVTYIQGPFAGHANDRAAFNQTPFILTDRPLLSPGEIILVDGGFRGSGHTLHQFCANEFIAELTEEEKRRFRLFNEDFTHNRAPIEHCIHRVKNRAQALTFRFPRARVRQDALFTAAARIYNRCRRLRMEHALALRRELEDEG